MENNLPKQPTGIGAGPDLSHADEIRNLVMRKMEELLLRTPESLVGRKVVAALVLSDAATGVSRVVSLGTGMYLFVSPFFLVIFIVPLLSDLCVCFLTLPQRPMTSDFK